MSESLTGDLPKFSMKQLLECGVHYGHASNRRNPKMDAFIFGKKGKIHIIDLQQTVPLLYNAMSVVKETVKNNGRILFVGTKMQAAEPIAEAARKCGQYYINNRWLGGTLTNWKTITASIRKMIELEKKLDPENGNYLDTITKKESVILSKKYEKLEKALGGIRDMGGKPDLLFVIDTNKEKIAIEEAVKLGIPVIAVVDTNSDPDDIDYPIPGNDDSSKSINLYCNLIAEAALKGIQESLVEAGVDAGIAEELTPEEMLEKKVNNKKKEREPTKVPPVKDKAPKLTSKKVTSSAKNKENSTSQDSVKGKKATTKKTEQIAETVTKEKPIKTNN